MGIHPLAVVSSGAQIAHCAEVGPFAVVESGAVVGRGARIESHCHIHGNARLEENTRVFTGAVIGSEPQDAKYRGEFTFVTVGKNTRIREYVTVNSGTDASGSTVIGNDCLLMAYCHVAHDCRIGDHVILANGVQMGGHVSLGSHAVVSGMTGIHQFTSVGTGAFIGGGLRVDRDVPPFSKALGEPLRWAGVNDRALVKMGLDRAATAAYLKSVYRLIAREGISVFPKGLEQLSAEAPDVALVRDILLAFLKSRKRGVLSFNRHQ